MGGWSSAEPNFRPRVAQRDRGAGREADPCWNAGRSAAGASSQLHPGTVHARERAPWRACAGGYTSDTERVRPWVIGYGLLASRGAMTGVSLRSSLSPKDDIEEDEEGEECMR